MVRAGNVAQSAMRDVLSTLDRWAADGVAAAVALLVRTERSTPLLPGAALAVSERGELAGSVTGGCVEPALFEEARAILAGEPARLATYGFADEEAFEVGLPCGGTVHVFVFPLEPRVARRLAQAVAEDEPAALAVELEGPEPGTVRLVAPDGGAPDGVAAAALDLLARDESDVREVEGRTVFVRSFAPRPQMYVVGALDHAAALTAVGRLLGYRVTVCDPRAAFATRDRFPDADEVVVEWPDTFLARAAVDERTAVCVLTHDHRLDVPVLKAALATPAGYVGAMGARRATADRAERLRAEGVSEEALARIHAPIGLDLGSRTPAEVAVSIAAELVAARRGRLALEGPAAALAR
jgi:xanthine dehydrogenase accessory factor